MPPPRGGRDFVIRPLEISAWCTLRFWRAPRTRRRVDARMVRREGCDSYPLFTGGVSLLYNSNTIAIAPGPNIPYGGRMINVAAERRRGIPLSPLSLGSGAHGAHGGRGAAGNAADLLQNA